jgi:hypothetical protein
VVAHRELERRSNIGGGVEIRGVVEAVVHAAPPGRSVDWSCHETFTLLTYAALCRILRLAVSLPVAWRRRLTLPVHPFSESEIP